MWDEAERRRANVDARLIHDGQAVEGAGGVVTGPHPPTDTLGFRWSAVNNLFLTAGDLAADEWRAGRSADEEASERAMRQFVWCLPVAAASWQQTSLEVHELSNRTVPTLAKGVVPATAQFLTVGVDLGKYLAHWAAVAWSSAATGHVVDYGRIDVPSQDLGVEQAIMVTLRQIRDDVVLQGWPVGHAQNQTMKVSDQVWVDAGYQTPVVYAFCREAGDRFRPAVGRGAAQQHHQYHNRPTATGSVVRHIGEGFHGNWLAAEQLSWSRSTRTTGRAGYTSGCRRRWGAPAR